MTEVIKDKTYSNENVKAKGKRFENCQFRKCVIENDESTTFDGCNLEQNLFSISRFTPSQINKNTWHISQYIDVIHPETGDTLRSIKKGCRFGKEYNCFVDES